MAIRFTDKGDEPKVADKAPGPSPARAADPAPAEAPEGEARLPFAKAPRPEKKRRGK